MKNTKNDSSRKADDKLFKDYRKKIEELSRINENLKLEIVNLKQTKERLKRAEKIGKIGNWEFDVAANNISWSDQVYELFGRNPKLGPPTVEEEGMYYSAEVRNRLNNYAQQVIETGKPLKDYEFPVILNNGENRFFKGSMFPATDKKGNVVKLYGTFQDITAVKSAGEESRLREDSLLFAQRLAHIGIYERNFANNEVKWSDEFYNILGYIQGETIPSREAFLERVHPEERSSLEKNILKLNSEFKPFSLEHRIVMQDGTVKYCHSLGNVILNDENKPVTLLGFIQDITEMKKIETETLRLRSEMARMDRVITVGNMASAIAHEINQPLTSIVSNSQAALRLLKNNTPDLDEVQEALTDITDAGKRAGGIIRSVRTMVKKDDFQKEPYNINNVIREVAELVQSETIIQNTSLTLKLDQQFPVLIGDSIQIHQVVLNLVKNALDAVQEQPKNKRHISITSSVIPNEGVKVTVADTGSGVKQKNIKNIFTAFYSTKPRGMGLGLSVCQSIIENHGGRMWVESTPDGGAKFSFLLPVKKDND